MNTVKKRDKTDMFKVLFLIQNANYNIKQLAEIISASTRTIQAYISELVEMGNPIRTNKAGKDSYYSWEGNTPIAGHLNIEYMEGFRVEINRDND